MKDRLDRHQERLTEGERRRIRERALEAAARPATGGDAGFRRWAISFGVAVGAIVTVSIVLIVRIHEERQVSSPQGRPFEIVGEIPARPVPRTKTFVEPGTSGGIDFRQGGAEPFIDPARDSLSFFAVRVGEDSYRVAREAIAGGKLPHPQEIRLEEFVNSFGQGYPEFADTDLRVFADGAPAPFGDGTILLRIGIKAREADTARRDTIVARDVSAAVTFDARRVKSYRLLGFKERKGVPLGRNAVAAGYEVAALYEIHPVKGTEPGRLATVHVRYEIPGRGGHQEIDRPVLSSDVWSLFATSPARLRLDAAVARFADILSSPPGAGRAEALADLDPMVEELAGELRGDGKVGEFARLVAQAASLSRVPG